MFAICSYPIEASALERTTVTGIGSQLRLPTAFMKGESRTGWEGRFCPDAELRLLLAAVDDLQLVSLKNASHLIAGVHRPRTGAVQLQVGPPVWERLARLT